MATKKKAASPAPAVDIKALAAELGVPVKEGKVTAARDRFYVTIGATKKEVLVGDIINPAQIKALVGKPVSVIVSGKYIVAITGRGWKPPIITCYLVPEPFKQAIREDLRAAVLKGMVERQVITPALQERLLAAK
jgi:hypothetical protein